jgi:hypothetical protein
MAEKVKCPKCGEENYATDPMCLNCGAGLKEPPPAKPKPDVADAMAPPTPAPAAKPGPGQEAKPVEPAPAPPPVLFAWLRVLGVALGLTLLEMIILSQTNGGKYPWVLWGIHIPGALTMRIVVWTLIFGALRTLLIGGLVYLAGWSPSVALGLGGVLGWTGLGTIPGGVVVGFLIGLLLEPHKLEKPAP